MGIVAGDKWREEKKILKSESSILLKISQGGAAHALRGGVQCGRQESPGEEERDIWFEKKKAGEIEGGSG